MNKVMFKSGIYLENITSRIPKVEVMSYSCRVKLLWQNGSSFIGQFLLLGLWNHFFIIWSLYQWGCYFLHVMPSDSLHIKRSTSQITHPVLLTLDWLTSLSAILWLDAWRSIKRYMYIHLLTPRLLNCQFLKLMFKTTWLADQLCVHDIIICNPFHVLFKWNIILFTVTVLYKVKFV